MTAERLESLKAGLLKDFEAHKGHIPHQGLIRCTLCAMYEKELSRLEVSHQQ